MEMVLTKRAAEYFMDRERVIRHIDNLILIGFCVLVFFLPIAHTETVRAFSFGIPIGLWIIKMILSRRFLFSRTFLDLPILLFSIVAALSILTAVDPRYSFEEFIGEWVMGIFLFYLVVNNLRPEKMKYILGVLLAANLLMVNFGIYKFFHEGGVILESQVRASSLHSGVGTFSTYLVMAIPYILIALFFVRKRIWFSSLFILLSLNIFAFVLTYSRGCLVAIAALFLLVGWKYFPKKVVISFLVVGVLGISILAPQKISYYYKRLTVPPPPGYTPDSYHGRWILLKFTLKKIIENPFQMNGYGERSFTKKFKIFSEKWEVAGMWHAHNTFLNIAIQTGVQGLVAFCFLLLRLFKYCYARAKLQGDIFKRYYLTATWMMIITFFIRNLSDDFFIDDSALLLWFLIGMIFSISTFDDKNRKVQTRFQRFFPAAT